MACLPGDSPEDEQWAALIRKMEKALEQMEGWQSDWTPRRPMEDVKLTGEYL